MTPENKSVTSGFVWAALAILLSAWIAVTAAQIFIEFKAIERAHHASDLQKGTGHQPPRNLNSYPRGGGPRAVLF